MPAPPKSIFRKFRRSLFYLAAVFSICVGGYHLYGWNFVDSIYMVVITMFGVRDVAFLRPQSNRRSQGCCTSLDTEFPNRQGAYDLGPTPQEETVFGGRPTAGSRCKIRG
jgi:hypothetical protein